MLLSCRDSFSQLPAAVMLKLYYYLAYFRQMYFFVFLFVFFSPFCITCGDRMHVILNGEPLEEVDCFQYLESQVAADGGCETDVVHRMNEGYRAWGALKSVLSNRGLG